MYPAFVVERVAVVGREVAVKFAGFVLLLAVEGLAVPLDLAVGTDLGVALSLRVSAILGFVRVS